MLLVALLTACAIPPGQRGTFYTPGWQAGDMPGGSAARPRRSGTVPPARQEAATYRVVTDGTVGCADSQALRLLQTLRDSAEGTPRALAQAYREGRCMTAFRESRWKLEGAEGELMRLELLDPGPSQRATSLYFLRDEVEPQS